MKRIILTLCVFIALSSLADAARFYRCVDRDGNTIMTDNPPPDATCESKGSAPDLTPRERQQIKSEQQQIERKREGKRHEGQRKEELYNRIKKGMSQVEVKKILGEPFHTETGTSGFSTIYFDTWTYTNGNEDCIVRFQCSSSCRVIKVTIKKTE